MKLRSLPTLLMVVFFSLASAQAKSKKNEVSPVFQTAHTVYVESIDGDIAHPGLSQADRQAILQVQQAVREWNRYALTDHREKADMIIVVRKGHSVGDQDHLGLGPHPQGPQWLGPTPGTMAPMQTQSNDRICLLYTSDAADDLL